MKRTHCRVYHQVKIGGLGINRTNALSPLTAKIVVMYANGTAGQVRRFRCRAGRCITALQLNTAAPSCSLRRRVSTACPAKRVAERLIRRILARFVKAVRRMPPTFSTYVISNGHTCRLTHGNRRIRLGTGRLIVSRVRLLRYHLRRPRPVVQVHIMYDGKACVHTLTHSVNRTLRDKTRLAKLVHAHMNSIHLRSYLSPTLFGR